MNDRLCDVIAGVAISTFIIAIVFLFEGNPNIWNRLHEAAMSVGRTQCYKP